MDSGFRPLSVETMKVTTLLRLAFLAGFGGLLEAQVGKVAIRTTGISCGACAAVSEIQFRRLPGIENVAISLSSETITLIYKSNTSFDPRQIRQVLEPLQVRIVQFQVTAKGHVQKGGATSFFVAGKDRFAVAPQDAAVIPPDTTVLAEGIVDDGFNPAQMKVSNFKPLKE